MLCILVDDLFHFSISIVFAVAIVVGQFLYLLLVQQESIIIIFIIIKLH